MDVVPPVNNLVQETEISLPNDKPSSDAGDLESEEPVRKKPRVNSGDELKRVAEIIMVLSAMGKIRAGRNPSAAEKGLMVEAREKLAEICESLAPKDLLSRDAVRVVMEDLGLQKVKEPWAMEFRPSKLSISQRLTLSKRKMEEAQKFASQASHTSRTHTVSLGPKPDGQGVQVHPGGSHRFPLEKHNPTTLSSGNFQTASPIVPVSAMPTVSALNPPAVSSEVQAQPTIILMNPSSSSSAANDSHSFVLPRTEPAHFVLEQPHNGPSYLFPVRVNTSGDNLQENTLSSSLTPSVALPKVSASNKVLDHNSMISDRSQEPNNFQVPSQAIRDPNPKPFAVQTAPFQGLTLVQQPSTFYTPHNDIARNVQKILQPKVSDPPEWIPPSIDYMNRPMTCEVCKLIINDVESLLVCDACEKGVHIKCLQSFNQKVIPKGEWHCLKCVAISNGRPLPPKYGRVSRNAGTQKASMASSGIQAFSDKKAENTDQKIGHHKKLLVNNGNPGLLSAAQSASVGNISSEPSEDIKATSKAEPLVATSSILSTEGACMRTSDDPSKERAVQSGLPGVSEENGNQNAESKVSTVAHNLTLKVETRSLSDCSVGIVQGSSSHAETLCSLHSDNKTQVQIGDLVSDQISEVIKSTSELHRPASSQDSAVINSEVEQMEKEENCVIVEGGSADRPADNRSSVQALPDVEWVGDIIKVVDEKIYYGSCSINGEVFKLQDYVLVATKQDNFLPSKLQGLWEDSKTKLRWAILNKCFFPNELPEVVGRPCTPETNEVYESNHANVVAAHLIRGSCQVLPPIKFEVENERRKGKPIHGYNPIFLSKWFYDESKGLFRPVTD